MRHIHLHIHRHHTYDAFVSSEHPRGQPTNKGEFVSKGTGTTGKSTSGHLPGGTAEKKERIKLPGKTKVVKSTFVAETFLPMPKDRSELPKHIQDTYIPPGWTNVTYNPDPKGRCYVVGKDSKGRRQPRMNPAYRKTRSADKYKKIRKMTKEFSGIRKENEKYLKSNDPNVRQHAELMLLIMETGIRPGSERDTGAKFESFGGTTLEGRHVVTEGNKVYLRYVSGKHYGKEHTVEIRNKDVAKSLQDRAKKAGDSGKLFPSVDDNTLRRYSKRVTGYNPRDYRTLMATHTAYELVKQVTTPPTTPGALKKAQMAIATEVSKLLGNTPQIAFDSYISPFVFEQWREKIAA